MKKRSTLSLITLAVLVSANAHAEVTLDGTLGPAGALPGPNYQIGADVGQQHGGNLFHSFQDFNLQSHESATFSGPDNVQNIISRVTGGNPSSIDGILRSTIPNADMYFLNPYGIMFGPNAKLDVQGGFHASTADYLRLSDGGRFEARQPSNSLLTVAPVEAFGFLNDSPTPLSLTGSSLSVSTGKTLSLVAGDLSLHQTKLSATAGRINLASLAQSGEATLTTEDLTVPGRGGTTHLTEQTQINLSGEGGGSLWVRSGQFIAEDSTITAETTGNRSGGLLEIQAEQLTLTQGSVLSTNTKAPGTGGNIQIKANEVTVTGANFTGTKSAILVGTVSKENGAGAAGNLRIEAQQITVADGAFISADTIGAGNGGQLTLIADTVTVKGFLSEQLAQTGNFRDINSKISIGVPGTGKGGNLLIEARQISLQQGGVIIGPVVSKGEGGTITLRAKNLELSGVDRLGFESAIRTTNIYTSSGAGTTVQIQTENLSLDDGGVIMGFNHGKGKGSQITIHATGTVTLKGTSGLGRSSAIDVSSLVKLPPNEKVETPLTAGPAGSITLEVEKLVIQDGGRISSSSIAARNFGSSQGGKITIQANTIELTGVNPHGENEDGFGSGIYARTIGDKAGDGGKITLTADTLLIKDGGMIQSSTNNAFKSGDIDIQVTGTATLTGDSSPIQLQSPLKAQEEYLQQFSPTTYNHSISGIYASSNSLNPLAGQGGKITLRANALTLSHHAKISSQSLGDGEAGELTITAKTLQMFDQSEITTSAHQSSGGDLHLTATEQLYLHHGQITTSVQSGTAEHNGGNIIIERPQFVVLNQGQIKAQAYAGNGGNIRIVADQFIKTPDSLVSASSKLGLDGQVIIDSPAETISGSLLALGTTFTEVSSLLPRLCTALSFEEFIHRSRFLVNPIAGSPPRPDDLKPSSLLLPITASPNFTKTTGSDEKKVELTQRLAWLTGCHR